MTKSCHRLMTAKEWRRRHLPGPLSKVLIDADVRDFVLRGLKTMTFGALEIACRDRFGRDRAPSRSSLHRFWKRLQADRLPKIEG